MQAPDILSSRVLVAQNMPRLPVRTLSSASRGRTTYRVEALAFPVTRTKDRLQSPPPPSRFPDVELSTALPNPFPEQATVARDATAQASVSGAAATGPMTWYTERVESSPIPTKAMTSFFGFMLGDVLAQRIAGDEFDALRCFHLGLYGLMLDGPIGHLWYKLLDSKVHPDKPKSTAAVLIKTAADQIVWAPIMTMVFFAFLKGIEGHPELIWPTIQDKLVKTVVANYILWPMAHFINFRFVPSQHRILYNNVVAVFWNAWLSSFTSAPTIVDTDQLADTFNRAASNFDQSAGMGEPLSVTAARFPRLLMEGLPEPLHVTAERFSQSLQSAFDSFDSAHEPLSVSADRMWRELGGGVEFPKRVAMSPTRTLLQLWSFPSLPFLQGPGNH